jgi:hypothetical protein
LNFRKVPTFNEFARWVLQEIGFLIDDPRVTDEALITELVYRLTQKRCLLVLDQLEAVQESPDLESFGEFLQTWRQRGHKSVVVITTRSSSIVAKEANYRLDLASFTEAERADFFASARGWSGGCGSNGDFGAGCGGASVVIGFGGELVAPGGGRDDRSGRFRFFCGVVSEVSGGCGGEGGGDF